MPDRLVVPGRDPIPLHRGPRVMGILNLTPDSFSDGGELLQGRHVDEEAVATRALDMLGAGADLLDLGGESTRPGADPVPADQEWRRVAPALRVCRDLLDDGDQAGWISLDTRHAPVAERALRAGADVLNDVGGLGDPGVAATAAKAGIPIIAMRHADCHGDIVQAAARQLQAIRATAAGAGVAKDQLVLDPGLGFGARPGPSPKDNLALVDSMPTWRAGHAVLIGASRKRFVGALMAEDDPKARVAGSVQVAVRASRAGADLLRVHDVQETVAALRAAGLRR